MNEAKASPSIYERSLEFGCVDLRTHPNGRIRSHYFQPGSRKKIKHVIDLRDYQPNLRAEIMRAVELCWESAKGDDWCHKVTLGIFACADAFRGFSGETFAGLPDEAAPRNILESGFHRQAFNLIRGSQGRREDASDDIWRTEDLPIPPERLNHARPVHRIDFSGIENEGNKSLVKEYVAYRIRETTAQLSTIYEGLGKIREFEKFLQGGLLVEVGRREIERFEAKCLASGSVKYSANKMASIKGFYDWLHQAGRIAGNPFSGYRVKSDSSRELKVTAPSDRVISRIGAVLPSLPFEEELQFLILKCTGMRISELCLLERGCLEKTEAGDCFLRFWCQKMGKDVQNVIPPSLYAMIEEYIELLPAGRKYLFASARDSEKPATCGTVVGRLSKSLAAAGVRNDDGTPYRFAPHSMRHKMAVQLTELDAPLSTIREQLHHASGEMTGSYLEFDMKKRASKAAKFIDSSGVEAPFFVAASEDVVETKVDWMREKLNAQILPNGVCGRPVALGECKKCNACLDCEDFRTSFEFIDVHKDHLQRTRSFIDAAKAAGWTSQIASAERLAGKLERIIESLEK